MRLVQGNRALFGVLALAVALLAAALATGPQASAHAEAQVSTSAENGRIAWSKSANTPPVLYTLWTMNPDGSDKQQVPYNSFVGRMVSDDGNFRGVQTPVWDATGTTLAGTVQANCVYGSPCGAALGTVDPVTGTLHTLSCVGNVATPGPPHECRSSEKDPTWSPDGSQLAFVQTIAEGCTSTSHPLDDPCRRHAANVLWKVTIGSCPTNPYDPCAERTPLTPVANEPLPDPNGHLSGVLTDHADPSWSPDGSGVLVARQRDARPSGGGVDNDLVVVAADGSGTTSNLTADLSGTFGYPDWAPDGTAVFAVHSTPSPRIVRLGTACTGAVCTRISFTEVYTPPSGTSVWDIAVSPDGRRLAFTAFSASLAGTHIVTVATDGTDLAQLTHTSTDGASNSHPTWQPLTGTGPTRSFSGLLQPQPGSDGWVYARAGSTLPIHFSLGGDFGLDVLATGSPTTAAVDCTTGTPVGAVQPIDTVGDPSLRYDPVSDAYTITWQTQRPWHRTCRNLVLTLDDGQTGSVLVDFDPTRRRKFR
jgi:hypothetical protein